MRKPLVLFALCLAAGLCACGQSAAPVVTPTPIAVTETPFVEPFDVPGTELTNGAPAADRPVIEPPAEGELCGSYYNDFLRETLTISEDGAVLLSGADTELTGTWTEDGDGLSLTLDGAEVRAALDADGDLELDGRPGYYLRNWALWGITPSETGASEPAEPASLGTQDEVRDNGDGTVRCLCFSRGLAFTCPADMLLLNDRFLGAVAVTDGDGGYVIGRNVSAVYSTHSGSDDEFMEDYVRSFVFSDFEAIYGATLSYQDLTLRHDGIASRLADATLRLGSSKTACDARVLFYTSTYADGTVEYVCKTILVPADDAARLESLAEQVHDLGAVRLVAEQ